MAGVATSSHSFVDNNEIVGCHDNPGYKYKHIYPLSSTARCEKTAAGGESWNRSHKAKAFVNLFDVLPHVQPSKQSLAAARTSGCVHRRCFRSNITLSTVRPEPAWMPRCRSRDPSRQPFGCPAEVRAHALEGGVLVLGQECLLLLEHMLAMLGQSCNDGAMAYHNEAAARGDVSSISTRYTRPEEVPRRFRQKRWLPRLSFAFCWTILNAGRVVRPGNRTVD
jgi:hypothetical protein